jgi:hypothetical protein
MMKRKNPFQNVNANLEERKYKVIRKDNKGGEIRQTCGSIGFQIFQNEKFISFNRDLKAANTILDKLQKAK